MIKKIILALFAFAAFSAMGQNLQLHYDMGKDRGYATTTLEMFKPDKYGSTFWFVDMDYNSADVKGVSLAYWEIARGLKFWESPFEIHLEYNGGFGQWQPGSAYQINDAFLLGGNYTWHNGDFSKVLTMQGMYKYIQDKNDASFQVTAVWGLHFFDRKLSLTGFADFWKEDNSFGTDETKFVFLTEPQIWYNINPNWSVGGEVELSSNFAGNKGFMANPTVAAKWTF